MVTELMGAIEKDCAKVILRVDHSFMISRVLSYPGCFQTGER